jgi:hypothetical protein
MPDIQTALKTALSKTLQQWDDDGEDLSPPSTINTTINNSSFAPSQNTQGIPMTNLFNITNNVSRETFNYIKNNPGSTRKEIMRALEDKGLAGGSVSSLIAQMRRNKMIHTTNDLYYADIPEYRPIKSNKAMAKIEKAQQQTPTPKRKYTKRNTTGIGALLREKLEAIPAPSQDAMDAAAYAMGGIAVAPKRMATIVRYQEPDEIIKNLTVFQARELYDRLKQIFGG